MIKLFKHKASTVSHAEARTLIARFFDGDTSLADEQKIYEYFAAGHTHSDLQKYGPMFGWYANNLQTVQKSRSHHWVRWAAAAAIVGVIGTVAIKLVNRPQQDDNSLAEMYAGSYIIRNGQKITDINKILPEVLAAQKMADEILAENQKITDYTIDDEKLIYESLSDISDPNLRRQITNEIKS